MEFSNIAHGVYLSFDRFCLELLCKSRLHGIGFNSFYLKNSSCGLWATVGRSKRQDVTKLLHLPMTVGELVLETLSTGVITEDEVAWLTDHLQTFSRPEEAAAIRLGRLMDEGQVNLVCRVSKRWLHHREVLVDWIEPLGRHS